MTDVLKRKEKFGHRFRQRDDGYVKMKAEIGGMLPQAKQCQEPPGAGRGKDRFLPGAFGGA